MDPSQFPDFRIRSLHQPQRHEMASPSQIDRALGKLPGIHDAVISRLSKQRYDTLLTCQPDAALRYVDDDDGELVEVGSAFELDQKLRERASIAAALMNPRAPMHVFDVARSREVIKLWKQIEADGKRESAEQTITEQSAIDTAAAPSSSPITPSRIPSYPLVAPRSQEPISTSSREQHETRWASYGNMPGNFDQTRSAAVTPIADDVKEVSAEAPASENQAEHEQQPLLDMFEAELAKLVSDSQASADKQDDSVETTVRDPPASILDQDVPISSQPQETAATTSAVQIVTPPVEQSPGEVLAKSLRSLFDGVGLLASTILTTNGDLRQHISMAQHDFPHNLDKALQASVTTLNNLRGAIVPPRSAWASQIHHAQNTPVQPQAQADPASSSAAAPAPSAANEAQDPLNPRKFEAERIVARRYITYGYVGGPEYKQYLIRWAGHGPDEDVWYDAENLWGCQRLVEQFERQNQDPLDHEKKLDINAQAADIHCRTAGDRMVTFRRSSPEADNVTTVVSDIKDTVVTPEAVESLPARRSPVEQWLESAEAGATDPVEPSKPIDIPSVLPNRTSSVRSRQQPASSSITPDAKLRHRQSWHPNSNSPSKGYTPFVFSPDAVMAKYPSVSQLERAASIKEGKRRASVPRQDSMAETQEQPQPEAQGQDSTPLGHRPEVFEHNREVVRQQHQRRRRYDPLKDKIEHGPPKDAAIRRVKSLAFQSAPAATNFLQSRPSVHFESGSADAPPRRLRRVVSDRVSERPVGYVTGKVRECIEQLVEMGFSRVGAEQIAITTNGDLESAIDVLQEDRDARMQRGDGSMPGGWTT